MEIKWGQLSHAAKQRFSSKNLEQFAVYWTDEPGWHSELQLRNNLSGQGLTVTPYLRSADGTEVAIPQVDIAAGEVLTLNVHDVLLKAAPQLIGAFGSVVFRYQGISHHALGGMIVTGSPVNSECTGSGYKTARSSVASIFGASHYKVSEVGVGKDNTITEIINLDWNDGGALYVEGARGAKVDVRTTNPGNLYWDYTITCQAGTQHVTGTQAVICP
jgi:hypothetical protein